jgi:hypothetical protein
MEFKMSESQLEKKSETHYLGKEGYYIFKSENNRWIFVPFEKEFNDEMLLEVVAKLNLLNK